LDIFEAIYSRRSCRDFDVNKTITEESLEKILETARFAPSPENTQQWRFIVSRDSELKKLISDISQERAQDVFGGQPYEIIQGRVWYLPEKVRLQTLERAINGTLFQFPEKSDALIFCCYTDSFHDNAFPDFIYTSGLSSLISLSMAIQNMWLAATVLGIGCGFMTIPFGDKRYSQILHDLLGVPISWKIITVLCLGMPEKKNLLAPSRFPLKEIVFDELWGRPYKINSKGGDSNDKAYA